MIEHLSHIVFTLVLFFVAFLYVFRSSWKFNFKFLTVVIFVLFIVFHLFPSTIHISHFDTLQNQGFHDCCINPQITLTVESILTVTALGYEAHYLRNEVFRNIATLTVVDSRAPPLYS